MKIKNRLLLISAAAVLSTASFSALAQNPLKATIHSYGIAIVQNGTFSYFHTTLTGNNTDGAIIYGPPIKPGERVPSSFTPHPFKIATLSDTKFPTGLKIDFSFATDKSSKQHKFSFSATMNASTGGINSLNKTIISTSDSNKPYQCKVFTYATNQLMLGECSYKKT